MFQFYLTVCLLFFLLRFHQSVFLPMIILKNTFILPKWLLILINWTKKNSFSFWRVRLEKSYEYDIIWKVYFSNAHFAIFAPKTLERFTIRVNALPMTFLESFFKLSLIHFSRGENVGAVALHTVSYPITKEEIVWTEEIKTLSFFFSLQNLAQVNRAIFVFFFSPIVFYVDIGKHFYNFLLIKILWQILLEPKVF